LSKSSAGFFIDDLFASYEAALQQKKES